MIVVFSFLLFREAVSARQMIGIALSLAGAAIIIGHGDPLALLRISLNRGDLWVIAAVASYAIYSALLRKRPVIHPLSFLATTFLAGALMLAPFYAWESWSGRLVSLDTPTLTAIGYVAIFPSILAYLCFNRGVELVGANRAGLFVHLMPVFGSLMAVLFLGERLEPFHGAGILFILAGIAIATRKA
jgi:drug/metabolite transporter (DMT)-like permease